MAEITVDFASRMIAASERGEHSPLTINEENQLAYAWLCLDMLRRLVKDGHTIGAVALLADPAAMAAAYRAEYREDEHRYCGVDGCPKCCTRRTVPLPSGEKDNG